MANNYLNHVRPSLLQLSEKERYENAEVLCNGGDQSACAIRRELAELSKRRDRELQHACLGSTPELCSSIAKEAIAAGNIVYGTNGSLVYANSPESGPIIYLNTATLGSVSRPESFHDAVAKSSAEALLLESGNQAIGILLSSAARGVRLSSSIVKEFFASSRVSISEDAAVKITLNFGRDGDRFTTAFEQLVAAEKSNWITPEGRTWWPANNGVVPGTEIQNSVSVGMRLDRYGGTTPNSRFLAPSGTPIEQRALSPSTNISVRDEYIVARPFPVEESNSMPWFGSAGMGRQFDTLRGIGLSIQELVKQGYLKKVIP